MVYFLPFNGVQNNQKIKQISQKLKILGLYLIYLLRISDHTLRPQFYVRKSEVLSQKMKVLQFFQSNKKPTYFNVISCIFTG